MSNINLEEMNQENIKGHTLKGEILNQRPLSIKDAGVDSKIFHVWKAKGLVDFVERGKWARLSLVEYLWLQVLETMRKFGCSIKLMKNVYDELFTRAFEENLAEINLLNNLAYYQNLKKNRPLTIDETELLQKLEEIHNDPQNNIGFRSEISYFYQLVLDCLKYKAESGIIIFEDGTFCKFSKSPYEDKKGNANIKEVARPHLYIPISSYLLEFIEDKEKDKFLIKTGLLSEDEYRVIREIRNKNVKSIKITFKENEHSVEKIECDKKGLIKGEEAKKVMALLGLKNYAGIQLNTRDGKTLSFTHN